MFVEEKRQGESQVQDPIMKGFIAWLRKQDPKEQFDFSSFHRCPCARYSHSLGLVGDKWAGTSRFDDIHNLISAFLIRNRPKSTYGDLLDYMVKIGA